MWELLAQPILQLRSSTKRCKRVWGCALATHPCQEKVARLLDVGNLKTYATCAPCDICALKMAFRGGNNSEHERKINSFGPTACFTSTAPQSHTLPKCV